MTKKIKENKPAYHNLKHKSRRSVLNYILSTAIGGFLVSLFFPVIKYLIPPKIREANPGSVLAGNVNDIKPNSGRIIKFGRKPVILLRTVNGDLRAFSAICTHLECIVQYRPDFKHIWCACHNGHYDLKGLNIAGPPPKPLQPFKVNIKNDEIYISKVL